MLIDLLLICVSDSNFVVFAGLTVILNYRLTKCHVIYIRRQIKSYAFYAGINNYLWLYVVLN